MTDIFTPWRINRLELKNRLVRSATWEGNALPDGSASHDTALFNAAPAEGGVGLIITGFAFVEEPGRCLKRQLGAHIDAMIGPLARIADAVHKSGGKVALQLAHGGALARQKLTGMIPKAVSAEAPAVADLEVRELDHQDLARIKEAFFLAAARAKAAEFDAVELHMAHGYLLSQFLSPLYNTRRDEHGGSVENRTRFCIEVLKAVREAVGPGFPVIAKLNSEDGVTGGQTLEMAIESARLLEQAGCHAFEISGGSPAAGRKSTIRPVKNQEDEAYFLDNALRIKDKVNCPVIAVGGFRKRKTVEKALKGVDAVAMSRPFICQPDLAQIWRQGKTQDPLCDSCGRCLVLGLKDQVACVKNQA
ncbi:NADH:flavin oxidoreductase [Dethiosulfatarculus sandiegensis]|uniref:NADH-dependent flavin oxidoreductase n=1 Tax=Dethiosulfatarculus sandiegensis TaxID=1429043 RepID=A0A0D2HTC2_9BACT|nr:NADH:flavin oxidoreductase [Dethiosulfatarculus sandiegensis]KIX13763.1 NADH-dependent flavin oxidoreductase [Dethiosulfatarculus sandiegensis]